MPLLAAVTAQLSATVDPPDAAPVGVQDTTKCVCVEERLANRMGISSFLFGLESTRLGAHRQWKLLFELWNFLVWFARFGRVAEGRGNNGWAWIGVRTYY